MCSLEAQHNDCFTEGPQHVFYGFIEIFLKLQQSAIYMYLPCLGSESVCFQKFDSSPKHVLRRHAVV